VTKNSAKSHHAGDELVDEFLTVAPGSAGGEIVSLLLETSEGGGELEGPEEVVGFLEVGTDGPDLVDKVFHAGDAEFAENRLDDGVVVDGNSGAVDLTVASGVDELAGGGAGGVTVGDKGFNKSDHVHGGLVELDENTVVELSESKELHDLLLLGGKLVDTSDSDNEGNLGLGLYEEVSGFLGLSSGIDEGLVSGGVLLGVLLGVGGLDLSLDGALLLVGITLGLEGGEDFGITGQLLLDVFGYNSCPKTNQLVIC
jgi:hypothetical protein